jgi:hypothetical protein
MSARHLINVRHLALHNILVLPLNVVKVKCALLCSITLSLEVGVARAGMKLMFRSKHCGDRCSVGVAQQNRASCAAGLQRYLVVKAADGDCAASGPGQATDVVNERLAEWRLTKHGHEEHVQVMDA